MNENLGCLYVVATPIGDPRDITLRALDTLREATAIICEERREGTTLLKKLDIQAKELIELNEHNEAQKVEEIALRLVNGQKLALISDCGTPVFADPGSALLRRLVEFEIPIIPVPGPSSLMTALSILDYRLERFIFAGFLPRDRDERRRSLKHLRSLRFPIVLMDAPYRLAPLLEDLDAIFGAQQTLTIAMDLTLPTETLFRGTVGQARRQMQQRKAEFVMIIR